MQIEFLGSGGAITTPRPGCLCQVCAEAHEKGLPYSRTGPSIFIHGPNILFDTPEEIKHQLNRSHINHVKACFYSHWHPDHVMGRRVWEMNMDVYCRPPQHKTTNVYVPQRVAYDFRRMLGTWEHLLYFDKIGLIRLIELADDTPVQIGNITIHPFPLAEKYVYAFLLQEGEKRILIILDEIGGWDPPVDLQGLDLAIVPMGLTEFDALTGERRLPTDHPALKTEATFQQTLEIIRKLKAKRVIISHIEEMNGLSYDDFLSLEQNLQQRNLNVTFAHDTMKVDV